jgi:hypothetical protein
MTSEKGSKPWNRCDECGRFIPFKEFSYMGEGGKAVRRMIRPDNEFGGEDWETLCEKHSRREP